MSRTTRRPSGPSAEQPRARNWTATRRSSALSPLLRIGDGATPDRTNPAGRSRTRCRRPESSEHDSDDFASRRRSALSRSACRGLFALKNTREADWLKLAAGRVFAKEILEAVRTRQTDKQPRRHVRVGAVAHLCGERSGAPDAPPSRAGLVFPTCDHFERIVRRRGAVFRKRTADLLDVVVDRPTVRVPRRPSSSDRP